MSDNKQKRGRAKAAISRIEAFCNSINDQTTTEELETRRDLLESSFKSFQEFDDLIFAENESESQIEEIEEKYLSLKAKLLRAISRSKPSRSQTPIAVANSTMQPINTTINLPRDIYLPKLHIPVFCGDYQDWPAFQDLFESTVNSNDSLSASQKFQYLKGVLKGDAASVIKHLMISDANYAEAWDLLKKRFDRKGHVASSLVRMFLNQPNINNATAISLRQIVDTSNEVIRGLKALGSEAEKRDIWLIHIILSKLDTKTKQLWASENVNKEFTTFNTLLDFLSNRSESMETLLHESKEKRSLSIKAHHVTKPLTSTDQCPSCAQNHFLYQCNSFLRLSVNDRKNLVTSKGLCFNCLKSSHTIRNCKSKSRCRSCGRTHHTLLHIFTQNSSQNQSQAESTQEHSQNHLQSKTDNSTQSSSVQSNTIICNALSNTIPIGQTVSLIPTARLMVSDNQGKIHFIRAMLDSASQGTFISESLVKFLGLQRTHAHFVVNGFGKSHCGTTRGKVTIKLASHFDPNKAITVEAHIMGKLTSRLPPNNIDSTQLSYIEGLTLADPHFNKSSPIDILIGVDYFFSILRSGNINVNNGLPIAQNTLFGWVLGGKLQENISSELNCFTTNFDLDHILRQFWEIEENLDSTSNYLTKEEQEAEDHFTKTVTQEQDGRFVVALPFKNTNVDYGDSKSKAWRCFLAMERKRQRSSDFNEKYIHFMKQYEEMGHMSLIPQSEIERSSTHIYYLPHHAVYKDGNEANDIRVVFNGSSLTSSGTSLNKNLLVGTINQRDLYSILLSFRTFKFAFSTDIRKMFRQIKIQREDQDFLRILWRYDFNQPINHYRLTTVTYGTASAPFQATRVLKEIANKFKDQYPEASNVILNYCFMDDFLYGNHTEYEAIKVIKQLIKILDSCGMELCKWKSNSLNLLNMIQNVENNIEPLILDNNDATQKVLGMQWNPSSDSFSFAVNPSNMNKITKRSILSESSRIFDPMGLLSPTTVLTKSIFQHLWLLPVSWDDQLPDDICKRWLEIHSQFPLLREIKVPRWVGTINSTSFELHGFADASERAYAAVVYCKTYKEDSEVDVYLLTAKTKVAPLNQISIARLELCGALLLTRLLKKVTEAIPLKPNAIYGWTDSQIVLDWLSDVPKRWNCYVANRTSEIIQFLPRHNWNHVSSKHNPADCASRGLTPSQLINHSLYWSGPEFLKLSRDQWPKPRAQQSTVNCLEERKNFLKVLSTTVESTVQLTFFEHVTSSFSSWSRLIRVLAYCCRFKHNILLRKFNKQIQTSPLTVAEIQHSTQIIIKWVQSTAFQKEIEALRQAKQISATSKLFRLAPFIDEDGILRVGGRIQQSDIEFSAKHPIILPKEAHITKLIIIYFHQKYLHAGSTLLFSIIRRHYWIISGRSVIKQLVHKCVQCFKANPPPMNQMMGNLPKHRVTVSRPFLRVGVDYAGPFKLYVKRTRGARPIKGYISVFVCFNTKAVHFELVSDLTTESFVAAFRRFCGRRGVPSDVYSDNGTNFIGAKNYITDVHRLFSTNQFNSFVSESISNQGTTWHFIPPSAPNMGGLWENAVKQMKTHIKRVVGDTILTFEEMMTLLCQIEAILNSRPLCAISADPDDLDVLTPSHFINGGPITTLPEINYAEDDLSRLDRYKLVQAFTQRIWHRWQREYLTSLQYRGKWCNERPPLKENDLVLIIEPNLPVARWVRGRVVKVHPGKDNKVRVATIRTSTSEFQRPISKLSILPIN